ncbi:L,D-transpeptidase family protein [Gemmobacter serpentinus]|uniref:L,D-transpeptidase family protein n=1 Tax=Gemmobacter serpentinus TaxID=2652247 RepID=UPI00124DE8EF|nr:L,D-transpeptidase family protein [Gemmobacter serpentinus]
MRKRYWFLIAAAMVLAVPAYTKVMARLAPGTPPAMAPVADQADRILVEKSARRMELWQGDTLLARYDIALGGAPEAGHKQQEGDERTPEGQYIIDWRNARSIAHMSLHISYPHPEDSAVAASMGVSPGGAVMIHGLPNGWGALGRLHLLADWTDGCIGVTNAEMEQIWSLVPDGTPIEIRP